MFFLYNSHPFYILSSEIDLRKNPHLRLLQFNFNFWEKKIRDSQDDVIRWFNSICESVTSRPLVVGLYGLVNESEICNKIQDMLLALHTRIETLSVFLSRECFLGQDVDLKDMRKLFSRLYEAGIVVEKWLDPDGDEAVSDYLLTSKLPYLLCSCLECCCFRSVVLHSNPHLFCVSQSSAWTFAWTILQPSPLCNLISSYTQNP